MKIGTRSATKLLNAVFQKQHWTAARNMFRVYDDVTDAYLRYLFGRGTYPVSVLLKTPIGTIKPTLHSYHDILTVNEIFCREDYGTCLLDRVIVDFGSNIGISALYFLTRNAESFVFCHEPLPMNCERFKANLAQFRGRYQLSECAVALQDGIAQFGYESSGRYGGIGKRMGRTMTVESRNVVSILSGIVEELGDIDVLKIDIESLEKEVLSSIPESLLRKIKKIYVEQEFEGNPLQSTHSLRQYGAVAQFLRIRHQFEQAV